MVQIRQVEELVWPSIEAAIDHLGGCRKKEQVSDLTKAGLNFSIILSSACYVEGTLETLLRALLECRRTVFNRVAIPDFEIRKPMNLFYNRLEEDLADRIGRSTGASGYDEMFELLLGEKLSGLDKMRPLWEGVVVLFNFRNVLGHGRLVSARQLYGARIDGGFQEEFSGSYRVVEDYLRKKSLLDRRIVEAHSDYLYLRDNIADHFWAIAQQVPDAVVKSLRQAERDMCVEFLQKRRVDFGESSEPTTK